MRYIDKENKITLSLFEFVATARRRLSPLPAYDSDEPCCISGKGIYPENTVFPFACGGISYELHLPLRTSESGEIIIERFVSSSPKRPKKEETAQIRGEGYICAYVYAENHGLSEADISFSYINSFSGECLKKSERVSHQALKTFFESCSKALSIYGVPEINRVTKRLPSLAALKFPYRSVRDAQREFISSAYRSLSRGGKLYAQAPTGTGKTVSALYPALRALGSKRVDKVFYLTPKSTTANAAVECTELMCRQGALIKACVLTAKDKCCTEGRVCKMSRKLCKNSASNKIAEAVLELYNSGIAVVDEKKIVPVSKKYKVCPYELCLAYSELCDLIICDFNYLFDPFVYIKRYFALGGKYCFLVDEAHNLPERIRSAWSSEICIDEIAEASESEILGAFSNVRLNAKKYADELEKILYPILKEEIRESGDGTPRGAVHSREVPEGIYDLFSRIKSDVENELFENHKADDEEKELRISYLGDYYYKLQRFSEILMRFDESYEMFLFYDDGRITLKLFCLDTGAIIKERLSKGHSALLFSATLTPLNYYKTTLGADRSDESIDVASPFDPSQLSVNIMDRISTRFSERDDTLSAVIRVISAAISSKRGNYMVFSPSFAYSEALEKRFRAQYPKLRVISQKREMTRNEKDAFLAEFKKEDRSYLIAFAVMGGIYAEGIDLAGEELIGAVIVGIGLPGLSYEREAIAAFYEEKFEEGKQYAYIYPGMNRVFQAAGRVIRREDDKGIIVLIDDRFDDPIYKKSLPSLWKDVKFHSDARDLKEELDAFWRN